MKETALEMKTMTDEEFDAIVHGWEDMLHNTDRKRYFGYVDRDYIKSLNEYLGYRDTSALITGIGVGCVATIGCLLYLASRDNKKEDESGEETTTENKGDAKRGNWFKKYIRIR